MDGTCSIPNTNFLSWDRISNYTGMLYFVLFVENIKPPKHHVNRKSMNMILEHIYQKVHLYTESELNNLQRNVLG